MIQVLGSRLVFFWHGVDGMGVPSQVTCISAGQVVGYVREARRASSIENFAMSSGARLGHKAGADRIGIEALELAAPRAAWEQLAAAVRELDALDRPVLRSTRWSLHRATTLYTSGKKRDPW